MQPHGELLNVHLKIFEQWYLNCLINLYPTPKLTQVCLKKKDTSAWKKYTKESLFAEGKCLSKKLQRVYWKILSSTSIAKSTCKVQCFFLSKEKNILKWHRKIVWNLRMILGAIFQECTKFLGRKLESIIERNHKLHRLLYWRGWEILVL